MFSSGCDVSILDLGGDACHIYGGKALIPASAHFGQTLPILLALRCTSLDTQVTVHGVCGNARVGFIKHGVGSIPSPESYREDAS